MSLVCDADNGSGVLLEVSFMWDGVSATLNNDMLHGKQLDLGYGPRTGERYSFAGHTGNHPLDSFRYDRELVRKYFHQDLIFDANNSVVIAQYSLERGIFTLIEGPVEIIVTIPNQIEYRYRYQAPKVIYNIGIAQAIYSDGSIYTATCKFGYWHE
ncbi:MAG: hypothetical protein HN730_11895 [Bdellovibrionales bacterium]|nr:hypothetical protein [Bdellovibrionales bacterium]MBT7767851.1 hypothetical protein [Bdellovibrionales bacterium]